MSLTQTLQKLQELESSLDTLLPELFTDSSFESQLNELQNPTSKAQLLIFESYLINSLSFILLRINGYNSLELIKTELKRAKQYWEKLDAEKLKIDQQAAKRIVKNSIGRQ